jgi:nitroreductase
MTESNPVLEAIYRRRATRAFTPAVVTEAQIRALLGAAVHAPSAMHIEPWAFVIVQDRALLARISDRAKALVALPPGADHRPLIRSGPLADPAFNIFYTAGTLVVICAKTPGPFATADCWLAAENLMLAATSLGLATCPIGFALPALGDAAIRAELGIPEGVTPVAPIIVGVAAAEPPAQARRDPQILAWKR